MSNPFDNEDAEFLVLVNDEGQYSIWPVFASIPEGWFQRFGPAPKAGCLDYVNSEWTDMRPLSLVRKMEQGQSAEEQYFES